MSFSFWPSFAELNLFRFEFEIHQYDLHNLIFHLISDSSEQFPKLQSELSER